MAAFTEIIFVSIWSSVFFVAGVAAMLNGFVDFKRKRLLEDLPTSNIRGIAMGIVELYVKVVPQKTVKSPLAGTKCSCYKYAIGMEKGQNSWVYFKQGIVGHPFYLKDKTGKVLVDPKDAEIEIPPDSEFNLMSGKKYPASLKKFLDKISDLGLDKLKEMGKRRVIFRETCFKPNDKLYILGTADDNPHKKEATAIKGVEDIMIQKAGKKSEYIISSKKEFELLAKHRTMAELRIAVGACLIIATVSVFVYIIL